MPDLIVVNGPPGIGKSTLARRYVGEHPLSLALEQDVVRGLLGGWNTRETESGHLARRLCVEMARVHLGADHHVIVPQFVAMPSYLEELAEVARSVGARHIEVLLLTDLVGAERRFHRRSEDPGLAEHQRVAAGFIEAAGGYAYQYQRLLDACAGRATITIDSAESDILGTYRRLLQVIAV